MPHSANARCYEEDHFVSLELGGDPRNPKNLWPEPYKPTPGAREKDWVETFLKDQVCNGAMTVQDAQRANGDFLEGRHRCLGGGAVAQDERPRAAWKRVGPPDRPQASATAVQPGTSWATRRECDDGLIRQGAKPCRTPRARIPMTGYYLRIGADRHARTPLPGNDLYSCTCADFEGFRPPCTGCHVRA
jgi:hypothetical protein